MSIVQFIPTSQRKTVFLAAQDDSKPVLIIGSSGTGKGALAKWIHANSPRSIAPFIEIKREISRDRKVDESLSSQILAAHGGSLMISEIGEFSRADQMVLDRYLTTKTLELDSPIQNSERDQHLIGAKMRRIVNTRIIATTSQKLDSRARGGLFNPDLNDKFSKLKIEMPELSERHEEFTEITAELLAEIKRELHREYIQGLSNDTLDQLQRYRWPGNLRELRNVLRIAAITAPGDWIELKDLPELGAGQIDFLATRDEFEKIYLTELLKTFNWKIDRTAEATKMDQKSLQLKIQKFGIDVRDDLH